MASNQSKSQSRMSKAQIQCELCKLVTLINEKQTVLNMLELIMRQQQEQSTTNPSSLPAQMANAQMANAQMANAQMPNAQMANAQMANAQMANAQMANAQMANAQMTTAEMTAEQLNCNEELRKQLIKTLKKARLQHARLWNQSYDLLL